MAARGSLSKEIITKKILENFGGSFLYDKEIRIPMMENGERLQIKCVLTAAKTNVIDVEGRRQAGGALEECILIDAATVASTPVEAKPKVAVTQPSADEKKAVADLMAKLGL